VRQESSAGQDRFLSDGVTYSMHHERVNVIDWLLDSDPAIRWQVMRDLTDAPADVVAAERAKVATDQPSRWTTLHALRVLRWAAGAGGSPAATHASA